MTKARILANLISDNAELADGQISVAEVVGAAPLASPTFTGTASGTFSGPLTGDVVGNLTGDVTGDVTGALTGDVTAPEIDLTAISSTIADTAVDVFVYDTRKDSDGGAWRKRTQGTSWYNETLNTATRGSRKEFPSVAVIVAESNQVTIYDGDDPDMPMWMVFNPVGSGRPLLSYGSGLPSSVSALNGIIGLGLQTGSVNDGQAGIGVINFISEVITKTNTAAGNASGVIGPLIDRNIGKNSDGVFPYGSAIINNTVNDVDMTVLPNAPIDAATGLPVPTVAIATNGGVSIIKDDGTVLSTNSSNYVVGSVKILPTGEIYFSHGLSGNNGFCYNDNFERLSGLDYGTFSNSSTFWYVADNVGNDSSLLGGGLADENAVGEGLDTAVGTASGLTSIALNPSSYDDGMVAWRTSTWNSGWMNGDIKLATLSDTDDTNVTSSELVTNGDFSNGTTGWVASQSTASGASNKLTITPNSGVNGGVYQSITTVVGKTYVAQVKVLADAGSYSRLIAANSTDINTITSTNLAVKMNMGAGTHNITFVATATTTNIWLVVGGGTQQATEFDDVSVRLAEEDRSVNGLGLQVFGTVTKSAVATGADLVRYDGWSGSNYLQQPYNSDLDFGTGDFCYMFWFANGTDFGDNNLIHRAGGSQTAGGVLFQSVGGFTFNVWNKAEGVGFSGAYQTFNYPSGVWNHLVYTRRGSVAYAYLNGKLVSSATDTTNMNLPAAKLRFGGRFDSTTNYFRGDLALFRASATAPSPEQIAKIYNDEKVLSQENAQATLYGSSDAVTALAYDDTTELLHVGTSAGRSVFQGLKRVDNTTTAVGAAISASNGLVADE